MFRISIVLVNLFIAGIVSLELTIVNVVTIQNEPFVMPNDCDRSPNVSCNENHRLKGFCIDFLDRLTEKVPWLDYRIKIVDDNKYGTRLANGSWTGLIGAVLSKKADVAIAPIVTTPERENVVDFSEPFMMSRITAMMKKPSTVCTLLLLFEPFSLATWICILLANIFFVLIVAGLFFINRRSEVREKKVDTALDTVYNCLQHTPLSMVNSELYANRGSSAIRLANITWWIFMTFIVAAYIANLATILSIHKESRNILTVEDLAKQSMVRYGILKSGSTQRFFENTADPLYRRMWMTMNRQKPAPFVSSYREGIEKVRSSKGRFAFFLEEPFNDYTNSKQPCDTFKLGGRINGIDYRIVLQKNSRFKEYINTVIGQMRSSGELEELRRKWFDAKSECDKVAVEDENIGDALTLGEMAIAFFILLFGLTLVILAAIYEYKLRKKKKNGITRL